MRRLGVFLIVVAVAFLGPAPQVSAAPPSGVAITTVFPGYRMAYVEWTGTGATSYKLSVWDSLVGGTELSNVNSSLSPLATSSTVGPSNILEPSTQYFVDVTLTNNDGSTTSSPRVAFTTLADPVATDPGASSLTLTDLFGYNGGLQFTVARGSGVLREVRYFAFSDTTTWSPSISFLVDSRPLVNLGPVGGTGFFPNGTPTFVAAVGIGDSGFTAWSNRVGVVPSGSVPWPTEVPLATAISGGAALRWQYFDVAGFAKVPAAGYRIEYTTNEGASWTTATVNTQSTDTTYTVTGL